MAVPRPKWRDALSDWTFRIKKFVNTEKSIEMINTCKYESTEVNRLKKFKKKKFSKKFSEKFSQLSFANDFLEKFSF